MKKKIIALFALVAMLLSTISVNAQSPKEFVKNHEKIAVDVAKKYKVFASIMMAQAIVESGFGKSSLAANYNNYFGMKGPGVVMDGDSYQIFASPEESFIGYAKNFYKNSKIYSKYLNSTDPISAIKSLDGIYSTSDTYSNQVIQIMNNYNLYYLDDLVSKEINEEKEFYQKVNDYKTTSIKKAKDLKETAMKLFTDVSNNNYKMSDDAIFDLLPCLVEYSADDISRLYSVSKAEALTMIELFNANNLNNDKIKFNVNTVNALEFNKFFSE